MEKIKQFIFSETGETVLIVLIIILTGTGAFGLGRLSTRVQTNSNDEIAIEYLKDEENSIFLGEENSTSSQTASVISSLELKDKEIDEQEIDEQIKQGNQASLIQQSNSIQDNQSNATNQGLEEKLFFASKNGKKFYSINCSAGRNIKQENKIYFSSREEAQGAGYTLSKSCQ